MSPLFCVYVGFQGEKNNGFDALYHIMKDGSVSSKEFEDFLRERLDRLGVYNYFFVLSHCTGI